MRCVIAGVNFARASSRWPRASARQCGTSRGVVWSRQKEWRATDAALLGSSYLKLPRLLQWFSGNIGFHHIHHLMPRVPNYRLEDCHRACAALLSAVPPLTLMEALRAPAYALWDEEKARMVRFSDLRIPARVR